MGSTTAQKKAASAAAERAEIAKSTSEPVPAYEVFVDESTRDNYKQMARDIAAAEGISNADALAKLADGFETQHERDPQAGWGHLAEWARAVKDPGDGAEGNLTQVEEARAVESARRDPKAALRSSDAAVAAAEEELARRGKPAQAELDGVVPNTGPAEGVDVGSSADQDED